MAMPIRPIRAILPILLIVGLPTPVLAAADPAAAQIDRFDAALSNVMRGGAALGVAGRARALTPTVEAIFDIPVMTRFAVGPTWTTMSDGDRQALTEAFRRLIVANYAHNFASEGAARFDLAPNVETRGPDKLVQCKIVPTHGDPANVLYRMRDDGGWKVIDVYYNNSISELTTKRADFASSLASGGAKALISHIDSQIDKLMK